MSLLVSPGVSGLVLVVEAGSCGDIHSGFGMVFDDQVRFSNIGELVHM